MDSSMNVVLFFACSFFLQGVLGTLVCDNLPTAHCAFAIDASGKRCLLENMVTRSGMVEYTCRTSDVKVDKMANYVESDQCISACGVDRNAVGISSDSLLEPEFVGKLCSSPCYEKCANIVDLYFNLAAGEGVFLPDLCKNSNTNPRRAMASLMSNGVVPSYDAAAPTTYSASIAAAPSY